MSLTLEDIDYLGFTLCNCCKLCFEHCVCDTGCGDLRVFIECRPMDCKECLNAAGAA